MRPVWLAIGVITTLCAGTPAQQTPDFNAARDETARLLSDLVKIDTSNPPGNETKAAEYIRSVLAQEGIASEIIESAPGRGSLVARLKGNGGKKPLLLLAHIDVVPVEREHWTFDPFGGVIQDGYVYGRGAIDDKSSAAAHLEVALLLKKMRVPLDRDVILLFEAGEETDPDHGMKFLVEKYWDKIDCEFALNEGGTARMENGKVVYVGVGTAQKMPRQLVLRAAGTSGHGSIPRSDNPVVHLAAAVEKAGTWETPVRLNETTREFFKRLASVSPPADAEMYRKIEDPAVQAKLRRESSPYYSTVRTSVVPTIIRGGIKDNVVPASAEAVLDVRALPDENLEKFVNDLKALIADPQITIEKRDWENSMPASPAARLGTEMFAALERAQQKVYPEAITIPFMSTGANDSAFLLAKGVQAYGIRMTLDPSDGARAHGNDERAPVKSLGQFVEYVYHSVVEVAGTK